MCEWDIGVLYLIDLLNCVREFSAGSVLKDKITNHACNQHIAYFNVVGLINVQKIY